MYLYVWYFILSLIIDVCMGTQYVAGIEPAGMCPGCLYDHSSKLGTIQWKLVPSSVLVSGFVPPDRGKNLDRLELVADIIHLIEASDPT